MTSTFAVFDIDDPLARIPGESERANAGLRDYFYMGVGRSLRKLLAVYKQQAKDNPLTKPPSTFWNTIASWSDKFFWQDRVARLTELENEKDRQLWDARRREIRETDFQNARRLRDLFNQAMDESPSFIRQRRKFIPGRDGSPDREIITLAFDASAVTRMIETASKLDRLAAELETERSESTLTGIIGTTSLLPPDLSDYTDEQIAERLSRQSKIAESIAERIRDRRLGISGNPSPNDEGSPENPND